MSNKRVIIGQSEYGIGDDKDAMQIVQAIKTALENGTVADLELRDADNRRVRVLINGKAAPAVVIDLNVDPRPSEISG